MAQVESQKTTSIFGVRVYDYGARFYDPILIRFVVQDRFIEMYKELSSYNYCANNPIRFIDYNGDFLTVYANYETYYYFDDGSNIGFHDINGNYIFNTDEIDPFLSKVALALGELGLTDEGETLINRLAGSINEFNIQDAINNKEAPGSNAFLPDNIRESFANIPEIQSVTEIRKSSTGSGGIIYFNPLTKESGLNTAGNRERPVFVGLAHELVHGNDADQGVLYYSRDYTNLITGSSYKAKFNGLEKSEWRAVFYENIIRGQASIPLRTNYGLKIDENGKLLPLPPRLLDANNNPINYTIK